MTEKIEKLNNYKQDNSNFGGIIYPSDFNTDYRGTDNTKGSCIAYRILQDRRFDEQCQKNSIYRNRRNEKC